VSATQRTLHPGKHKREHADHVAWRVCDDLAQDTFNVIAVAAGQLVRAEKILTFREVEFLD
jgi:hypothetical protein